MCAGVLSFCRDPAWRLVFREMFSSQSGIISLFLVRQSLAIEHGHQVTLQGPQEGVRLLSPRETRTALQLAKVADWGAQLSTLS